jgi:pSer/pThr/pTyr-binding forkhead associated (FHA) protein
LHRIGGGAIGAVHLGYDHQMERFVAIKRLRPDRASNAAVRLFVDEARAASRLRHGAIVAVYEILHDSPTSAALVLELIDGESLRARIRRDGALAPAEAVRVLAEVGRALSYAHQNGVVHRDVKPSNILIADDGRPKLLDFGVAHVEGTDGPFRPGTPVGTAGYAAPEQSAGNGDADHRVDVYGLGATLRETLTGLRPDAESPPAIQNAALAAIVERACQHNPDDRYPAMDDLVAAMETAVPQAQRRPDESQTDGRAPLAPAILRGLGENGRIVPVAERITVGRGSQADVRVKHRTLSRVHAKIVRRRTGEAFLFDMDSMNGISLDELRVIAAPLPADSVVQFGDVRFRFEEGEHLTAAIGEARAEQPSPESKPTHRTNRPKGGLPAPGTGAQWPPPEDPDPTPPTVAAIENGPEEPPPTIEIPAGV